MNRRTRMPRQAPGSRREGSVGPDPRKVGPLLPVRVEAGEPGEPRKFTVIIRGHRARGGAAAATLGEGGYNVLSFCIQDQPAARAQHRGPGRDQRREELPNDGDSVTGCSTTRSRAAIIGRASERASLAEVSVSIIDQCVAQGVPFAREYGGLLDNVLSAARRCRARSYARGQTGQQLLLVAYQAMMRQVGAAR